ncbi:MAG: nicotinamide riboside transporter PnuC [Crocinitomicaceae bacterium]
MENILESILRAIQQTSFLEWTAVILGVSYVISITYKKMIAWLFALISSSIYVYLCFSAQLYLESFLQIFYVLTAIYGWLKWRKDTANKQIISWGFKLNLINISLSSILTLSIGYIFSKYTNQANPYMDAFTTIFSLIATFMVARKVLENWIYWIIIDAVSIILYSSREFYLTSLLFTIYTLLALFGFIKWYKNYKLINA